MTAPTTRRGNVELPPTALFLRMTLAACKLKPEQAMVVCGGFRFFLDRNDKPPPPVPPAGTMYTTVVAYSFYRVSEMASYGAGRAAPGHRRACLACHRDRPCRE